MGGNEECRFWAELLAVMSPVGRFLQTPGIFGRRLRRQEWLMLWDAGMSNHDKHFLFHWSEDGGRGFPSVSHFIIGYCNPHGLSW